MSLNTETTPFLSHRGHIPSLDGIRGIAILMVMVFHFFPESAWLESYPRIGPFINKFVQMGFCGVELFFVLSGFLITGILLNTKNMARRDFFTKFYSRRILRIFPLYYGVLLFLFFILPFFVNVDHVAEGFFNVQWKLWLYLTNVPIGRPDWDASSTYWLGHFWSLAVEEHFYMVWPLILFCLAPKRLWVVCIAFLVLGNVARISNMVWMEQSPWFFHWSTVRKVDGLVVGAMLALLVRKESCHERLYFYSRLGLWALGPIFFVIMMLPRSILHAYGMFDVILEPVMVLLFGALLIVALKQGTRISKLLSNRLLIWFGTYSYGLYVFHGLLRPSHVLLTPPDAYVAFFKVPVLGLIMHMATWFAVSIILAYLSYHLFEKHFLRLKKYFSYSR